jgi:adenylosuccinate lyase
VAENETLFRAGSPDTWGRTDVEELFGEIHSTQLILNIEAAMARVQARLGIIPQSAADEITRKARAECIDQKALFEEIRRVVHPMVAILNVWARTMEFGAGEYVHYGATTMDIWDTTYVLQLREAAAIMLNDMREIEFGMMNLAQKDRDTPMIGRTLGQHALPITFGFKVGAWITENRRNIERLKDCMRRLNTGILSGAVGTYAGFGERGFEIEALTMQELGLGAPDAADWHGARDRYAEFGNVMAMIGMTFGKIGQEIFLLQATDIGEVEEYESETKVGSSTMPHKRNPNRTRTLVILSRKIRRNAEILLDWMVSIHERDQISSAGELKEICLNTDRLLKTAKLLLGQLVVKPVVMLENLDKTKGLIMAEEVMFVLGKRIGKHTAHEVIRRVAREAHDKNMSFRETLLSWPDAVKHLNKEDLDLMLYPKNYIGLSREVVDRVVEETKKLRETDAI